MSRRVVVCANHLDVTAALMVAAYVADQNRMPSCASRTRKIAKDLGHLSGDGPNILVLGEVTPQLIADIRAMADAWELSLSNAGLGVGHIWTNVPCPAYNTLMANDCICKSAL